MFSLNEIQKSTESPIAHRTCSILKIYARCIQNVVFSGCLWNGNIKKYIHRFRTALICRCFLFCAIAQYAEYAWKMCCLLVDKNWIQFPEWNTFVSCVCNFRMEAHWPCSMLARFCFDADLFIYLLFYDVWFHVEHMVICTIMGSTGYLLIAIAVNQIHWNVLTLSNEPDNNRWSIH